MPDLESYIKKLLEIQDERNKKPLTSSDLKEIAFAAGLTEEDWQAIEEAFDDYITRGAGHLDHGNWNEAIHEFEQALSLKPSDIVANSGIAQAQYGLWKKSGDDELKKLALEAARQCLDVNPEHEESLRLISDINKEADRKKSVKVKLFFAAGIFAIIFGLAVWLFQKPEMPPPPRPAPQTASTEKETAGQNARELLFSDGLNVPVRFLLGKNASNLQLKIESSDYRKYNQAYSYRLAADMTVSGIEIQRLRLNIELIDRNGAVIISDFTEPIREYAPSARSGDVIPVDYLEYIKTDDLPDLKEVRLQVSEINARSASDDYDPSPAVNIEWPAKPPNFNLEIRERYSVFSQGYMMNEDILKHEIVLEVENKGKTAMKNLELTLYYYDMDNQLISSKRAIIVLSSQTSLKPGQTRVYGSIFGVGKLTLDNLKEFRVGVNRAG